MEAPKGWPTFDLFPRLTRVAKAIGNLFVMHQLSTRSDHFEHGGGPMLDRELYDQSVRDFDRVFGGTVPDIAGRDISYGQMVTRGEPLGEPRTPFS